MGTPIKTVAVTNFGKKPPAVSHSKSLPAGSGKGIAPHALKKGAAVESRYKLGGTRGGKR